jgi:hypothetical protein
MNANDISIELDKLKVNSRGFIRGKNQAVDKLHGLHLKKIDSDLMEIRIFVGKISTAHTTREALEMIDEFIYKKQVS